MGRFSRWLRHYDGVHVLLADRSEVGWYGIEERDSSTLGVPGSETVPEHLHHNYLYTDTYSESKKKEQASPAPLYAEATTKEQTSLPAPVMC